MKKLLVIASVFLSGKLYAKAPIDEISAESLMQFVEDRESGNDFASEVEMEITSSSGKTKDRTLKWWHLEESEGSKDLLKFTKPKRMLNTGFLVYSHDNKSNEQWLFLSKAAKKKPRRISSSGRGKSFLGSDFYFVDFEGVKTKDFVHSYTKKPAPRNPATNNSLTGVISIPKDKSYVYSKLIMWIDKKIMMPVVIEMFQNREFTKQMEVLEIKEIDGIWTTMNSKMTHIKKDKQDPFTTLKITNIRYNIGLKESAFTPERLTQSL